MRFEWDGEAAHFIYRLTVNPICGYIERRGKKNGVYARVCVCVKELTGR